MPPRRGAWAATRKRSSTSERASRVASRLASAIVLCAALTACASTETLAIRDQLHSIEQLADASRHEAEQLKAAELEWRQKAQAADENYRELVDDLDSAQAAAREMSEKLEEERAAGAAGDELAAGRIADLHRTVENHSRIAEQARLDAAESAARLRAVETERASAETRAAEYAEQVAALRTEEAAARRADTIAALNRGSDLAVELGGLVEPYVPGGGVAGNVIGIAAGLAAAAFGGRKFATRAKRS